jgi:hypothetical protein
VISLTLFSYCLYYFLLNGFQSLTEDDRNKLLNLPPALIAVLGALFGLYVNYQVNSKNQKLKGAFDLVMTTRTSSEYWKNYNSFRKGYPLSQNIVPEQDDKFYSPTAEEILKFSDEEKIKYEAVAGLKNLLNFYEYVAIWINHGEVDEDMVYEFSASTVIGLQRAASKITMKNKKDNPTQGMHIDKLASKWEIRKRSEILLMQNSSKS